MTRRDWWLFWGVTIAVTFALAALAGATGIFLP